MSHVAVSRFMTRNTTPVRIMGILNVTPDSFSDGGAFLNAQTAVEHALKMLEEGADIIDIGGESTRPPGSAYGSGAERVSENEEAARVLPVISALMKLRPNIQISIDTSKADVARKACEAGAAIINDVSAGTMDERMFESARAARVPLILMHGYGPAFMLPRIEDYQYEDVVVSVMEFLAERIEAARSAGVEEVWGDVGIGFAKTFRDNMTLIREHDRFTELGVPMVIGLSRKSSIGKAMGRESKPQERIAGSLAATLWAVERGASIVRTHDVRETRDALNVLQTLREA